MVSSFHNTPALLLFLSHNFPLMDHSIQFFTHCSIFGPFHGFCFFKNCSSVGPVHRLQFIRNRLLQHWSPRGHRSCWVPAPVWILHGLQLPSGHIHIFHQELSMGCRVIIAPLVSSMGCSRAIASESAQAAGDSSF